MVGDCKVPEPSLQSCPATVGFEDISNLKAAVAQSPGLETGEKPGIDTKAVAARCPSSQTRSSSDTSHLTAPRTPDQSQELGAQPSIDEGIAAVAASLLDKGVSGGQPNTAAAALPSSAAPGTEALFGSAPRESGIAAARDQPHVAICEVEVAPPSPFSAGRDEINSGKAMQAAPHADGASTSVLPNTQPDAHLDQGGIDLYCAVCDVAPHSEEQLAMHVEGKKHRRHVAMAEVEAGASGSSSVPEGVGVAGGPDADAAERLRCQLCNVQAPSPLHKAIHLRSQKHQRREKQAALLDSSEELCASAVAALLSDAAPHAAVPAGPQRAASAPAAPDRSAATEGEGGSPSSAVAGGERRLALGSSVSAPGVGPADPTDLFIGIRSAFADLSFANVNAGLETKSEDGEAALETGGSPGRRRGRKAGAAEEDGADVLTELPLRRSASLFPKAVRFAQAGSGLLGELGPGAEDADGSEAGSDDSEAAVVRARPPLMPSGGSVSLAAAHFCPVCGIIATSEANLEDHMKGRRHARRLQYIRNMPDAERRTHLDRVAPGEWPLMRRESGHVYEGHPCVRVGSIVLPSSMDLRVYLDEVQEVGAASAALLRTASGTGSSAPSPPGVGVPPPAVPSRFRPVPAPTAMAGAMAGGPATEHGTPCAVDAVEVGVQERAAHVDTARHSPAPHSTGSEAGDSEGAGTPIASEEGEGGEASGEGGLRARHTCHVCGITTTSAAHLEAHLRGRKHRRRVEVAGGRNARPSPHHCRICDITTTSAQHMAMHLAGKAHCRRLATGHLPAAAQASLDAQTAAQEARGPGATAAPAAATELGGRGAVPREEPARPASRTAVAMAERAGMMERPPSGPAGLPTGQPWGGSPSLKPGGPNLPVSPPQLLPHARGLGPMQPQMALPPFMSFYPPPFFQGAPQGHAAYMASGWGWPPQAHGYGHDALPPTPPLGFTGMGVPHPGHLAAMHPAAGFHAPSMQLGPAFHTMPGLALGALPRPRPPGTGLQRARSGAPAGDQLTYNCEACHVATSGLDDYKQHLRSKPHSKRTAYHSPRPPT